MIDHTAGVDTFVSWLTSASGLWGYFVGSIPAVALACVAGAFFSWLRRSV